MFKFNVELFKILLKFVVGIFLLWGFYIEKREYSKIIFLFRRIKLRCNEGKFILSDIVI